MRKVELPLAKGRRRDSKKSLSNRKTGNSKNLCESVKSVGLRSYSDVLKSRFSLAIPYISLIFAFENELKDRIMGKIINKTITKIVTEEGISLFRRVTKVLMPNGKYRYPVDYFDATPGVVKISKEEMDKVAIPVYEKLI